MVNALSLLERGKLDFHEGSSSFGSLFYSYFWQFTVLGSIQYTLFSTIANVYYFSFEVYYH
jgi:hypothetical protein